MFVAIGFVAALGLLADGAAGPPPRPAETPGLSWREADALARTLADVQQHVRDARVKKARIPSRRFAITQAEANSYLNLRMRRELPVGLKDIEVRFGRGRVFARGLVDLDQVKAAMKAESMFNPVTFLSGVVPVEIEGALKTNKGFGQFEIEDARLGPVVVPAAMLHQIIAGATRTSKDPSGFDVLSPFRLPYSLQRIDLRPGKLILEF